ncbi:MAG: hypothetical protein HDT28_09345 [Clostridiales bacterium]|nr:hypothetical protein [Clostridiales bacterium]
MICPQCGYDMGKKNKCIRCGYEASELTVFDEKEQAEREKEREQSETKVIDPCNVYLTHPYGYDEYDSDFGMGDPFGSLFGSLFGDPIGDLLGGLFGFDVRPQRQVHEQPTKKGKKQGPVVEVRDVEMVDSDDPDPEIIFKDIDDAPEEPPQEQKTDDGEKKHYGMNNPFKRRKK